MAARYFEELTPGETHESPGITITDWHVMQFSGVSMDFFELHTNDEFARQTQFGQRVAHGLLGLAVTDGLKNRSTFQSRAIASLHWSWDFVGPIFIGDTVHVKLRVGEMRESKSKPDRGVVTLELELLNQRGEVVQKGRNRLMVLRRPGASAENPS
jgi:acyl dehydratase